MPKRAIFLTFIIFSCPLLAQNIELNTANLLHYSKNSKREWIKRLEEHLPWVLCRNGEYFIQCFSTDGEECIRLSPLLVKACLNNMELRIPEEMDRQHQKYWEQIIKRCSYDFYERTMQSKKLHHPQCEIKSLTKEDLPQPSQAVP